MYAFFSCYIYSVQSNIIVYIYIWFIFSVYIHETSKAVCVCVCGTNLCFSNYCKTEACWGQKGFSLIALICFLGL